MITEKRKRFNALLAFGRLTNSKPHILESYGVESTLELTEKQLDDAIEKVEQILSKMKATTGHEIRSWRHKCLKVMTECGVNTQDWNAINAFMLDKRICGKHLYQLDTNELIVLHRKLHNVRDNKLSKQEEINRLASMN